MATKGERGDVPAPWGAWLAFGVAMVCSGGLPAVVWAGCYCCGEGRPSPLWGRCGPLRVTHGPCNGHPTRRDPGKGRLWVGGGMGALSGSRGDRHLKAEQSTIFDAVARGFLFSRCRKKTKENKGTWGPTSSGHCGIHMPDTRPHTTPNPQATFARAPAGRVAIAGAVGCPKGTTTAPKRRRPALATTAAPCPQTMAGRPPEHTIATPNANQAPVLHPRGAAHHPARLWWPWCQA